MSLASKMNETTTQLILENEKKSKLAQTDW